MKIAVTGASGLIGKALVKALKSAGDDIVRVGRDAPGRDGPDLQWDPYGQLDPAALEGVDTIVHLAGHTVAGRWSDHKKSHILNSRVRGTETISMAAARMKTPPRALVSASAIGYYGSRGDQTLTEESSAGDGFLAQVCRQWEAATKPAEQAGIRVVHARMGLVLAKEGGALPKMLPAFHVGMGGIVGNGSQWWSWIALSDVISAIQMLIASDSLCGAINLVSPNPVTNLEFTKALARAVRRPALFPLPTAAVRFFFGEMGVETLLASQRVLPKRLEEAGFRFQLPEILPALRTELTKAKAVKGR
ncbi:MAG TPA: TIGR01777 family oxidoreductase [Terriglobales bacterium]|nr:TIGR01777 family oxidoreductase [Terriglobales bacterium]